MFARLPGIAGARVLDLYAGSGALGIEALSRGARETVFVERSGPALRCLERNLDALGLAARARVLRGPVRAAVARTAGTRFDLVLSDPPYAAEDADGVLAELAAAGRLVPGALVVREASRRHPPGEVPGLVVVDERRYGDTLVVRYTCPAKGPEADPDGLATQPEDAGDIVP